MTLRVPVTPSRTPGSAPAIKPELLRLLDMLPRSQQTELLNFARFLQQQTSAAGPAASLAHPPIELHVASATTLLGLTGLVALGGDAVADTESLYDGADNGLH